MALEIYRATSKFPPAERYGLVSQLRRAATSVPANIAEGCGCRRNREQARFVEIAFRSAIEVEYHLLFANDLALLDAGAYEVLHVRTITVKRMLTSFMRRLRED